MATMLDFAANCKNRPNSAYYEEVSAAMQQAVMDVLMGTKDVVTAVNDMQAVEEDIYTW